MLSDVYFPRVNGVSTSIRVFSEELRRQGHAVAIAAPAYDAPSTNGDRAGLHVERASGWRVPFDPEDRAVLPSSLLDAARRAAEVLGGLDVIHVHTPFAALAAGRRLRRATGVPTVATYHTHFEAYGRHYLPWLPGAWLEAAARRLAHASARAVDMVLAPTEPLRDLLHAYGIATPIRVVPTGLDLERFARGDRRATRARLGISDDQFLILHVGRLAHEKDVNRVLRVAAAAIARHPEASCVIAGEGPARAELERETRRLALSDRVRFLGYLDRERDLPDLYAAGDVLLSASTTETQGLVLLEAMAAGLPVVGVAALGTKALLDAQRGARAAAPDDAALSAALESLLAEPELRQRLSHEAREVASAWSIERTTGDLLAAYREISPAR